MRDFLLLGKSLDFAPLIIKVLYAVRQSVDSGQPLLIKVLNAIQRSVDSKQSSVGISEQLLVRLTK